MSVSALLAQRFGAGAARGRSPSDPWARWAVRYSAFISYNHRDRAWAGWLLRKLEGYRLPPALAGRDSPVGTLGTQLPPVFQDREELAASTDLAQSVRLALEQSDSLIVVCSTSGAGSRWVNEEVRTFIALGRRERIQCLIVPEPGSGRSSVPLPGSAVFPPALTQGSGEPLAADARPTGDGSRHAFLKLVAGIIGVRYDELRRREAVRRHNRLMVIAAVSAIGFLAMSALAAFALVARSEAVRERDIARQKTVTAQRTTDFVKGLFEISDPSEAKGASVTALQVLDRGAAQIDRSLLGEPNVKAEMVTTLSEVYLGLGAYRRADNMINRSLAIPVTDRATRARQLLVYADSQARQSNYAPAIRALNTAIAQLGTEKRDTVLLARLLVGRAEAFAASGSYPQANADAARALKLDVARDGPGAVSVARDLEALALSRDLAGNLDPARAAYQRALGIRLAAQGALHPKVSEDLNQLGTVAYLQRDSAAAEAYWERSLTADERVLGPAHPDLAGTLNNLARVLLEQRKFPEAMPLLRRSIAINLAQRDATHADLAFIFSNLALAEIGLGDRAAARVHFARALAAAERHHHRNLAPILTDLAALDCEEGNTVAALPLLDRAGPIMRAAYPDDPWRSAWVVNTRGGCLVYAGRNDEAKVLLTSSAPAIRGRWSPQTLYGHELARRLAMLDGRFSR